MIDKILPHPCTTVMNTVLERVSQTPLLLAIVLLTASALLVSACSDAGLDAQGTDESVPSAQMPPAPPTPPTDLPAARDASAGEDGVFVVVEQMPELIGGLAAVAEHITYTPIAKRAGVEGRVFLQFVVSKEGIPENIRVTRGIGAGLDEAAVEAVSKIRFIPGRQRGEAVPVKMSLPVTFKLDDGAATAPSPPRPE